MGGLVDASALPLIDLPLIRYTVHPYGTECDAWPPYMDERLKAEKVVTGWEVWCEATRKCQRCGGSGRANYSSGGAVYLNAIPCPECAE